MEIDNVKIRKELEIRLKNLQDSGALEITQWRNVLDSLEVFIVSKIMEEKEVKK